MSAAIVSVIPAVELKKIVVATDFSSLAEPALAYAELLARRYGSEVMLVHVWSVPPLAGTTPESSAISAEVAQQTAQQQLDEALHSKPLQGLKAAGVLRFGAPVQHIRALVEYEKADLLILGTRGRSGVVRALMGSVAESLIREVRCPVLTVGPKLSEGAARSGGLETVLVPTDLAAHSLAVIPYITSITAEFRSNVHFLHVLPEEQRGRLQNVARTQQRIEKLARPYFSPRSLLSTEVDFGDPAERILAQAEVHAASLIAMGVRPGGRFVTHLLENVGYRVIAGAPCPVLTVKHA